MHVNKQLVKVRIRP